MNLGWYRRPVFWSQTELCVSTYFMHNPQRSLKHLLTRALITHDIENTEEKCFIWERASIFCFSVWEKPLLSQNGTTSKRETRPNLNVICQHGAMERKRKFRLTTSSWERKCDKGCCGQCEMPCRGVTESAAGGRETERKDIMLTPVPRDNFLKHVRKNLNPSQ